MKRINLSNIYLKIYHKALEGEVQPKGFKKINKTQELNNPRTLNLKKRTHMHTPQSALPKEKNGHQELVKTFHSYF